MPTTTNAIASGALRSFAAQFGVLQTSWAFGKSWSFPEWFSVKVGLEGAGIQVESPPPELRRRDGKVEKNLVDMLINDQIKEEFEDKSLTVLVLVTGDVDHYSMVKKYLGRGVSVHIVGQSRESIARVYGELEQERLDEAYLQGKSDVDLTTRVLSDIFSVPELASATP